MKASMVILAAVLIVLGLDVAAALGQTASPAPGAPPAAELLRKVSESYGDQKAVASLALAELDKLAGVEKRKVNKKVADFPATLDLSTPESACAGAQDRAGQAGHDRGTVLGAGGQGPGKGTVGRRAKQGIVKMQQFSCNAKKHCPSVKGRSSPPHRLIRR